MSVITIDSIETLMNNLLERLRRENITELTFDEDNYWNVPMDNMSCFPSEPNLTIGSINDDIDFLNSLIDEDYTTEYLEIERLAAVLRFTARKLTKNKSV
jgi:hypothetical protein